MSLDDFVGFIVSVLLFLLIGGHNLFRFQRRGSERLQSILHEEEIDEEEIEEEEPFIEEVKPIRVALPELKPIRPIIPQSVKKNREGNPSR